MLIQRQHKQLLSSERIVSLNRRLVEWDPISNRAGDADVDFRQRVSTTDSGRVELVQLDMQVP